MSVSGSTDSAHQYIPVMNSIFACQRLHIPIDVCKLSGDAVFLQQASDATKGVYMALSEPRGLLQYLMMAFLPISARAGIWSCRRASMSISVLPAFVIGGLWMLGLCVRFVLVFSVNRRLGAIA